MDEHVHVKYKAEIRRSNIKNNNIYLQFFINIDQLVSNILVELFSENYLIFT